MQKIRSSAKKPLEESLTTRKQNVVDFLYNEQSETLDIVYDHGFEDYEKALLINFLSDYIPRMLQSFTIAEIKEKVMHALCGANPLFETPEQYLFLWASEVSHPEDLSKRDFVNQSIDRLLSDSKKKDFLYSYPMANYDIAKYQVIETIRNSSHIYI